MTQIFQRKSACSLFYPETKPDCIFNYCKLLQALVNSSSMILKFTKQGNVVFKKIALASKDNYIPGKFTSFIKIIETLVA